MRAALRLHLALLSMLLLPFVSGDGRACWPALNVHVFRTWFSAPGYSGYSGYCQPVCMHEHDSLHCWQWVCQELRPVPAAARGVPLQGQTAAGVTRRMLGAAGRALASVLLALVVPACMGMARVMLTGRACATSGAPVCSSCHGISDVAPPGFHRLTWPRLWKYPIP